MSPRPSSTEGRHRPGPLAAAAPAGWVILTVTALVIIGFVAAPSATPQAPGPPATRASPIRSEGDGVLAEGRCLVARPGMRDPNFAQTVVLLLNYGAGGARGLIVNQPTEVPLSALAPRVEGLAGREGPVYRGGPVDPRGMILLVRAGEQPGDSRPVFDDVYVSGSVELLQRLAEAPRAEIFRVYAGYAGWSPGQLEMEVSRGDWHVVPGGADVVFDERPPEEVWRGLLPRRGSEWTVAPASDSLWGRRVAVLSE